MNKLSARTIITNNEAMSLRLQAIVTSSEVKLMCACILSEIGRVGNGELSPGANAFVDAFMQYPFKPEQPEIQKTGLDYTT